MAEWLVRFEIDIEAIDARDAAYTVAEWMRDGLYTHPVLDVRPNGSEADWQRFDTEEPE